MAVLRQAHVDLEVTFQSWDAPTRALEIRGLARKDGAGGGSVQASARDLSELRFMMLLSVSGGSDLFQLAFPLPLLLSSANLQIGRLSTIGFAFRKLGSRFFFFLFL